MDIRLCDKRNEWETWFAMQEHGEFLQSWDWGEFQRAVGNEPLRVQVIEGGKIFVQAQGFVHRLPLGFRYMYLPRCEVKGFQSIFDYCRKNGFIFCRIEPINSALNANRYTLNAIQNRQPQDTLLLDLSQSEEEILNSMHAKTRYNIHLAEKKGVAVREKKDANIFWKLNQETIARDQFKSHGKTYYEHMLALPSVHQLTAYDGETPIASNIFIAYGDTCTYLHGASSDRARNLMATYLLQWRGMQLGKSLGCRWYDLWGVAPPSLESVVHSLPAGEAGPKSTFHNYCWEAAHPWTGITRFKAGFGGAPRSYPPAADVIFRPLQYWLYTAMRTA